ncbi:MAG: LysE family transporter [Pontimonas sp.]|nr:LysE family transporter [Pontimonas sp.]
MELDTWLLYTLAALGLSLTPGPNGLLALTHGALYGVRKTLFTIAGGALGFTIIIALSLFGIGALLAASAELLIVLKWAGGAYLVWLGIQVWRSPPLGMDNSHTGTTITGSAVFRQGLLAAVTNPKGILFFVAFLPQFLTTDLPLFGQFVVMTITFVGIEILFELSVAAGSATIQPFLTKFGKRFNQVFGGVFIAIGIALPLRG